MTTAKWTINTGEQQQDLCYRAARFNEKGLLPVWGGDPLRVPKHRSAPSSTTLLMFL